MKTKLFDTPLSSDQVDQYLKFLGVAKTTPNLQMLNQLISAHQHQVPFENITRICEFHDLAAKLPTSAEFAERVLSNTGGVCWTLARSFYELLKGLNYNVHYHYMDPGHVCLHVKLDQDYYVDVGFGAPLFKAMPFHESFTVKAPNEVFEYIVHSDHIQVKRTPGPEKKMLLTPVDSQFLQNEFEKFNIWKQNRFLSMLLIGKFFNERAVRLAGDVLQDFRDGQLAETKLNDKEIERVLEEIFNFDPALYFKAKNYLAK